MIAAWTLLAVGVLHFLCALAASRESNAARGVVRAYQIAAIVCTVIALLAIAGAAP